MKKKAALVARLILGLLFFVFGLNGFLQFIPAPPGIPEAAMKFSGALVETGYFFPVLKGTETICGLLLLTNIAAPLALVILAPIMIQIFLFHFFLTPGAQNVAMPIFMIILHVTAASGYWHLYRPLFARRAQ